MEYTEQVMDHFMNPRNMGEMEDASGIGTAAEFFTCDPTTKGVKKVSGCDEAKLFQYLSKLVSSEAVGLAPVKVATGTAAAQAVFEGLEYGYYVIARDDERANAVTIDTNNTNITQPVHELAYTDDICGMIPIPVASKR